MKKLLAVVLVLVCVLGLVGCSDSKNGTVMFHDQTFNKSDLSKETLEWLQWYNELSVTEQLSVSYIPSDLSGYDNVEDAPVQTE